MNDMIYRLKKQQLAGYMKDPYNNKDKIIEWCRIIKLFKGYPDIVIPVEKRPARRFIFTNK